MIVKCQVMTVCQCRMLPLIMILNVHVNNVRVLDCVYGWHDSLHELIFNTV